MICRLLLIAVISLVGFGELISPSMTSGETVRVASHPPTRPLPVPANRPLPAGPKVFVDGKNGSDQNAGTQDAPWKTLKHAVGQLKPGKTLVLRGGVYFERVTLNTSGTADQPITIRSYPGELVILDGGLPVFQTAPQKAWEPCPSGAEGEFRSTATYPDLGGRLGQTNVLGNFGDSLVPLHGYRHLGDLRSDNPYWNITSKVADEQHVYCGPGLWYDTESGRIHVRLAHAWQLARPIRFDRPKEPDNKPQPAWFQPFETHGVDESAAKREPFKMFSWGYFGWGNSADQLVKAVDAVERSRGFKPPLFVDIRIRRSVRAAGFVGSAFEDVLGSNRYLWMPGLGNQCIVDGTEGIKISRPKEAESLLNTAVERIDENRRTIFFCSCQYAKCEGYVACHRWTVGTLLLKAAERMGIPIEVEEWPGDEADELELRVDEDVFRSIMRGRSSIPLGELQRLPRYAGLPYGSILSLKSGTETAFVLSGPVRHLAGEWSLPVFEILDSTDDESWAYADQLRDQYGCQLRASNGQC